MSRWGAFTDEEITALWLAFGVVEHEAGPLEGLDATLNREIEEARDQRRKARAQQEQLVGGCNVGSGRGFADLCRKRAGHEGPHEFTCPECGGSGCAGGDYLDGACGACGGSGKVTEGNPALEPDDDDDDPPPPKFERVVDA